MKIAGIALTKGGASLLLTIKKHFDIEGFIPNKFNDNNALLNAFDCPLNELIKNIFNKYVAIVFIMSTGIVVRTIAPLIKSKKNDPAIIVIDEKGKNAISLLSGHLGGANELCEKIAKAISANPVITTASDVLGVFSPDVFAKKINAIIENESELTNISSLIVNGERVAFLNDFQNEFDFKGLIKTDKLDNTFKGAVILSPFYKEAFIPHIYIRPKSVVLGIGLRKNVSFECLQSAFNEYLNEQKISKSCVYKIATIELKKNEKAIIELSRLLNIKIEIIGLDDIKSVQDKFEKSDFVLKSVGVSSVCEPCAFLAAKNLDKTLKKYKKDGITLCFGIEKNLNI